MLSSDRALLVRMYDLLRLSRLNACYYERRLRDANATHLFFEITIALGTTGSIAAWAIWKGDVGAVVWAVIAGVATILAVLKPILAPAKRIELCTRQQNGWLSLYYAIDKLLMNIRQEEELSKDSRKRFDSLYDRSVQLHLEDEKSPRHKLLIQLQDRVNTMHPPESLWMPCDPEPAAGGEVVAMMGGRTSGTSP